MECTYFLESNHVVVYCSIALCSQTEADARELKRVDSEDRARGELAEMLAEEQLLAETPLPTDPMPVMEGEQLDLYSHTKELTSLDKGSTQIVSQIGYITYRNQKRLLLEINGELFRAGAYLEGRKNEFDTKDTKLIIGSTKTERSLRNKYVDAEILRPGSWGEVEYSSLPFISTVDGGDMRVRGIKRTAEN